MKIPITSWLPTTKKEMEKRGWEQLDIIIVSGDAYVDHPSFGHAVIARLIESEGFRVGLLPQPNTKDDLRDFKKLGSPKLFFGVTAGCMDSMVNHYTASKRLRSDDAYTPGGEAGFRPDRATIVYSNILKKLYPEVPVVIGGVEASLRRITHYDYWDDKLRPSILIDSGADLLVYGMGEKPILEILHLLKKGVPFTSLKTISGTAFAIEVQDDLPKNKKWETIELASHETCVRDKIAFANNFTVIERESNKLNQKRIVQSVEGRIVVVNPSHPPMSEKEMDRSFSLPYTRLPHPKYHKRGAIPAFEMIKFSVNMHRGCFGGCSFCTISAHQGKFIQSRSEKSILAEVDQIIKADDFKGYLSDLGGPSANMYKMAGRDLVRCEKCSAPSCIFPKICDNLETSHQPMLDLLHKISKKEKIKKVFVGSGIRYDLLLHDESGKRYGDEVIRNHVSGRLKVAPEHTSDHVLKLMRKPSFDLFRKFKKIFDAVNEKGNLRQELIPYFISSHPGCALKDMGELALQTQELGYKLEQVQDFTPTPMTLSTVIYYTGINPYGLKEVYVAKSSEDKKKQRKFFFWHKDENKNWIKAMTRKLGLRELIKY